MTGTYMNSSEYPPLTLLNYQIVLEIHYFKTKLCQKLLVIEDYRPHLVAVQYLLILPNTTKDC